MKKTFRKLLWIAAVAAALLLLRDAPASGEAPLPAPQGELEELPEFVPTEKLSFDNSISFPVDI